MPTREKFICVLCMPAFADAMLVTRNGSKAEATHKHLIRARKSRQKGIFFFIIEMRLLVTNVCTVKCEWRFSFYSKYFKFVCWMESLAVLSFAFSFDSFCNHHLSWGRFKTENETEIFFCAVMVDVALWFPI